MWRPPSPFHEGANRLEGTNLMTVLSTTDLINSINQMHLPASPSRSSEAGINSTDRQMEQQTEINEKVTGAFRLLDLPSELIGQVLSNLSPVMIAQVACTCHALRQHAYNELMWAKIVKELQLPRITAKNGHQPFGTWKEYYGAHYPFWFLPKHKIWFADKAANDATLTGQFLIARYDYTNGNIDLFRLMAKNLNSDFYHVWTHNPNVLIHEFKPRLFLVPESPAVRLETTSYQAGGRLKKEVILLDANERYHMGVRSRLFLTKAIRPELQHPRMALWPPAIFPSNTDRVRTESTTMFRDPAHKPACDDQISQTTFRTRVWTEYLGHNRLVGARMGEDVMTFSTLPTDCYTPTAEKPYQGIWVGDYSGHGCEFLVIIQYTPEEAERRTPVREMAKGRMQPRLSPERPATSADQLIEDPPGCRGRLEALKLTGDPNIPRGEYSFIVEDMGHKGLIRVAKEEQFKGARIVESWGHVAVHGFRDDGWIPAQLILLKDDCLAQYWEEFGHISYYRRVDIDQFLEIPEKEKSST